jgi:hypothetical protein
MKPLSIVVVGLSLSSSWGNGHATTYRALLSGLGRLGHRVLFLEREQPWYLKNRDLIDPDYCSLRFYSGLDELDSWSEEVAAADAVIVGSYVPDGIEVIDRIAAYGPRQLCFYDIDTPVTLARLADDEETYVARRQLPSPSPADGRSTGCTATSGSAMQSRSTAPLILTPMPRPARKSAGISVTSAHTARTGNLRWRNC